MTSQKAKFKTYQHVFDNFTLRNLFRLSSQGHFDELKSPLFMGKESNVFSAIKKDGTYVLVKIHRLETSDFNKIYEYIRYDSRFKGLEGHRRKIIFAWTQREYRNLMKAREAGVNVPTPYTFLQNILVMELIGEDGSVAPTVKVQKPKDVKQFFDDMIKGLRKLHKAGLVHGDLSEYNILNWKEKPVFIDLSHTTTKESTNAKFLLERDITNLARFFNKLGMKVTEAEIKKKITS